jgi:hypothetical protein
MPPGAKIFLTALIASLLPLLLWSLRPSQTRAVSPRWFRLGSKDPFFYLTFNEKGLPRKYTWCVVLGVNLIFLAIIWIVPST